MKSYNRVDCSKILEKIKLLGNLVIHKGKEGGEIWKEFQRLFFEIHTGEMKPNFTKQMKI